MEVGMTRSGYAYLEVLKDLRWKRSELDHAIASLERLAEMAGATTSRDREIRKISSEDVESRPRNAVSLEHKGLKEGIFLVLEQSGQPMSNAEIMAALKEGGLQFRSADPPLAVAQTLKRIADQAGGIVKLGRGKWGLR